MNGPHRIRVGVVGTGKMGENHLRKYLARTDVDFVGFFDLHPERAGEVSQRFGVRSFSSLDELLFEVDALTVAVGTRHHAAVAEKALRAGVHLLVEKPLTDSLAETDQLIALARENGLQLQVGFVERFRLRALLAPLPALSLSQIQFFRMNTSVGREPERDVITDLTLHDIDLALHLAASPVERLLVFADRVSTDNWDEAQTTLTFQSGAVASLLTSRVASTLRRGARLIGPGTCLELDFATNQVRGFCPDPSTGSRRVDYTLAEVDPLREEVDAFVRSVRGLPAEYVSAVDARESMRVALQLLSDLEVRPGRQRSLRVEELVRT